MISTQSIFFLANYLDVVELILTGACNEQCNEVLFCMHKSCLLLLFPRGKFPFTNLTIYCINYAIKEQQKKMSSLLGLHCSIHKTEELKKGFDGISELNWLLPLL